MPGEALSCVNQHGSCENLETSERTGGGGGGGGGGDVDSIVDC